MAPPPRRQRWWWIVGGTVVGLLLLGTVLLGLALAGGFFLEGWDEWEAMDEPWGWGAETITVGPAGDIRSLDLPVGACATTDDPFAPTVIRQVDCAHGHEFELYAKGELVLDAGVTLSDAAADACEPAFATYVGAAYSRSQYDYVAFVPDRPRRDDGERDTICAIRTWGGEEIVGSVAGIRR